VRSLSFTLERTGLIIEIAHTTYWFEVPHRRGFINITPKIEELVRQSAVTEGILSGERHAYHRFTIHQR
jgi:thiamine phosphate synthase YjbQ (UPF0047 family)